MFSHRTWPSCACLLSIWWMAKKRRNAGISSTHLKVHPLHMLINPSLPISEFLAFPSLDSLPSRLAQLHIPQCLCPRDHLLLTCDSRGVLLVTRHSPTELSMD